MYVHSSFKMYIGLCDIYVLIHIFWDICPKNIYVISLQIVPYYEISWLYNYKVAYEGSVIDLLIKFTVISF